MAAADLVGIFRDHVAVCKRVPPPDFDFDFGADVALRDLAAMQHCFTGSGGSMTDPCCVRFDAAPHDGHVDTVDYAAMPSLMTGP